MVFGVAVGKFEFAVTVVVDGTVAFAVLHTVVGCCFDCVVDWHDNDISDTGNDNGKDAAVFAVVVVVVVDDVTAAVIDDAGTINGTLLLFFTTNFCIFFVVVFCNSFVHTFFQQ